MTSIDTGSEKILATIENGVGWLTFNNPEKRNAMSLEMWSATGTALNHFASDPGVRVVVMQGAGGKAFISGADISQFEEKRSSAKLNEEYSRTSGGARTAMRSLKKPLIAKIEGYCLGGGLAVALNADFRIAAEGSRFGIPAARLGIVYGEAGIAALTALVGPGAAKRLLFTAQQIDAAEALRMGLIEEMVAAADLDEVTRQCAERIAANAPLSIAGAKEAVRQIALPESERDASIVQNMITEAMESADFAEGRRAFMEKRKPVFQGR